MFAIGVEIPQEIRDKCWNELTTIASKPTRDHAFLEKDYKHFENKKKIWNNVECGWFSLLVINSTRII